MMKHLLARIERNSGGRIWRDHRASSEPSLSSSLRDPLSSTCLVRFNRATTIYRLPRRWPPERRMRSGMLVAIFATASAGARHAPLERARMSDNLVAAGTIRGGGLTLRLDVRLADWHPDGESAPGVAVPAFAEAGQSPQIPGPMIRVPAGTAVNVTLRNQLASDTLVVRGLHARPGPEDALTLAPGESRAVQFRLEVPGTYYYYGTTTGRLVDFRTLMDAQLTGAIIVDGPGKPPPDRILVIGMWTDTVARAYTQRKRLLAVINGRSWPNTERLSYAIGDTVRWRIINASGDAHPMHLHGFYFRVDSRGDFQRDTVYPDGAQDLSVTEGMATGSTMRLSWVPERAGNWLFHCHIPEHFGKRGPLGQPPPDARSDTARLPSSHASAADHATGGMGGLVMGIFVRPRAKPTPVAGRAADTSTDESRRRIRLLVRRNRGGTDSMPFFGFALQEGTSAPLPDSGLHLGPPIVLVRGQPVGITVVNELNEPTAVHWHGIELQSYFDGVAGFSGDNGRISPLIAPRDSFEARFTPPRAGTFIYHTHVDEERQQPAGLAGPIIVLEPGAAYDSATNRTVIITSPWSFADQQRAVMVNGSLTPDPLVLRSGVAYRLRFVNMTVRRPALVVEFRRDSTLLTWRTLAKDGADLRATRQVVGPGLHNITIGETFDVEVKADTPGDLRLDIRIARTRPIAAVLPVRVIP
jgi:manganese oxidase